MDCFYGAKVVLRYSIVSGNNLGGCHGTDGSFRSNVSLEIYHMTVTNPIANWIFNVRGGTGLVWSNTLNISGAGNNTVALQFYRLGEQIASAADWAGGRLA